MPTTPTASRGPRVLIVAFDGVQTLDVTGPAEVFASAARVVGRRAPVVQLLSVGGGERMTSSSLSLRTQDLARVRPRAVDTVLVAGGDDEAIRAATSDRRLAAWVRDAARRARRVSSVCSGAFVLAAAGVLDGRRAATHWSACEELARRFPRVQVDPNAIFVTEGKVWTSAGVTTGIDMALAMVEEDHGRHVADRVAARLVLYVRRPGFQSQFSGALVAQTAGADSLAPAISWARAHLPELDVDTFARRAGLSLRTLHRRCHEQLGTTPAKLVAKLRVEQARVLLTSGSTSGSASGPLPAKTVAAQCGFGNATRMRRAFEQQLGVTPRSYRVLHAAR